MILQVGGERYPNTRYVYGGAWAWNYGGGYTVSGAFLCGSISVQAALSGRTSIRQALVGDVSITPALSGTAEVEQCG